MQLNLVVSTASFRNTRCEPIVYTGWRLDRGSQNTDDPVFVPPEVPLELRVSSPTLSANETMYVLDLNENRTKPPISPDKSDLEGEDRVIQDTKDTCLQLYNQWRQSEPSLWYKVELKSMSSALGEVNILAGLYSPWPAPGEKDKVFKLVERRVDLNTLSFNPVVEDLGGIRSPMGNSAFRVYQLSTHSKLGVVIDLNRSQVVTEKGRSQSLLHTLREVGATGLHKEQAYRMKQAREWAYRRSKLANVQYYVFHPTRMFMNNEQTLRKFNASYYLAPNGEPHPGDRWLKLQMDNLTKLDGPTVLHWLRIILLSERIFFLPKDCKSPQHVIATAKRLMANMAALPARACTYMSDCIDRCAPVCDMGDTRGAMDATDKDNGNDTEDTTPLSLLQPAPAAANRSSSSSSSSASSRDPKWHSPTQGQSHFLFGHKKAVRVVRPPQPTHLHRRTELYKQLLAHPSAFVGGHRSPLHPRARAEAFVKRNTTLGGTIATPAPVPGGYGGPQAPQPKAPQAKKVYQHSTTGYHTLTPEDGNTLFQGIYSVSRHGHATEQIDDYDGILDCVHPALACNDCETQGFTCWRCHQSLRIFFQRAKVVEMGDTQLERAWWKELQKLIQTRDMDAITLLCSIKSSAMEDGGKREGAFESVVRSKESNKEETKTHQRNLDYELEQERASGPIPQMKSLTGVKGDGSTWDWFPKLEQSPYDSVKPPFVDKYMQTYGIEASPPGGASLGGDEEILEESLLEETKGTEATRYYEGERNDDSPDLGCHVVAVQLEWPDLAAKAECGLIVEELVQKTGRSPTPKEIEALHQKFLLVAAKYSGNTERAGQLDQDPALMLMECTEYSHVQQMGNERNGCDQLWDNDNEAKFIHDFKKEMGHSASYFLQRLPMCTTKGYDMYHSGMEISSYALGRLYGAGSWTLYDLDNNWHGVDFKRLFSYTRHQWMHSREGRSLVLRPTTPPMSRERIKQMDALLWPLERQVPMPPRLESVTHPAAANKGTSLRVDTDKQEYYSLFVSDIQWATINPTSKQTLEETFQAWVKRQSLQYHKESIQVHGYLNFIALHIRR